jgi:hypothetical protein
MVVEDANYVLGCPCTTLTLRQAEDILADSDRALLDAARI